MFHNEFNKQDLAKIHHVRAVFLAAPRSRDAFVRRGETSRSTIKLFTQRLRDERDVVQIILRMPRPASFTNAEGLDTSVPCTSYGSLRQSH